jgi:hypothetical protein
LDPTVFTTVAAPFGLRHDMESVERWLPLVTAGLLSSVVVISSGWIVLGWLSALITYYPLTLLFIGLCGLTVWLTIEARRRMYQPQIIIGLAIGLIIESTVIFYVANWLLLVFLGLVWNA